MGGGSSSTTGASSYGPRPDAGVCDGAWLDQTGTCRTPADGVYPAGCCAPYDCNQAHALCDSIPPNCGANMTASILNGCYGPCVDSILCASGPQDLCVVTGGTWMPGSCGNYHCGSPPACAAVIPGCDCGRNGNFVDGVGCQPDRACMGKVGDSCGGNARDPVQCEPGLTCIVPAVSGLADVPGTCTLDGSYVCSGDSSCPTGASCCYPCGIPGCSNRCEFVDGNCPLLP